MNQVQKDMLVTEVLQMDAGLIPILQSRGMNCFGCPSSRGKTLETAATGHGADIDELVKEMNVYLQTRGAVSG